MELDNLTEEEQALYTDLINRETFCRKIMVYFKMQNLLAGLNASQGLYVHSRLRRIVFTYSDGVVYNIDLLNLVVSGDLELAYIVLSYMTPDDGSQPYHWLTSDKINYLRTEIAKYLGWV